MSIRTYIEETKRELNHVNWPTRNQAVNFTVTVIIFSAGVSLFLAFFDLIFTFILGKLIVS